MPNQVIRLQRCGRNQLMRQFRASFNARTALIVALFASTPVLAAPPPISVPISSEQSINGQPNNLAGFLANLKRSNFMLGDLFGLRSWLSQIGRAHV